MTLLKEKLAILSNRSKPDTIGADYNRPVAGREGSGGAGDGGFWAKITGSATDGDNKWKYSWTEVAKTSAGYGGWAVVSGGLSGTSNARNTLENMNAATGTLGNGVSVANLDTETATFALKACPANAIVWLRPVTVGATTEYWFAYANGVDGTCD